MVSWAAEVEVMGEEGKFHGNAIRLSTPAEAEAYARDLRGRWTLVLNYRVVETNDPVNYIWAFATNKLVAIPGAEGERQ